MSERVQAFGFGSYFDGGRRPRDIDLVLIHGSIDICSCLAAIACKRALLLALPNADIVLLSDAEAANLSFLVRARAIWLGDLGSNLDRDVTALVDKIRACNSAQHVKLATSEC